MRLVLIFLLAICGFARAAEPELLEPDKAFRFAARLKDARSIEVTYRIAPGYYMYRERFQFTLAPAGAKPGAPQLPLVAKLERPEAIERLDEIGGVSAEARARLADSAWLTVERKGNGQLVLFASQPAFRGYHLATARLFANAVVLGPGLGASQPAGW